MRVLIASLCSALLLSACGGDTGVRVSPYDLVAIPGQLDFGTTGIGLPSLVRQNHGDGQVHPIALASLQCGP